MQIIQIPTKATRPKRHLVVRSKTEQYKWIIQEQTAIITAQDSMIAYCKQVLESKDKNMAEEAIKKIDLYLL